MVQNGLHFRKNQKNDKIRITATKLNYTKTYTTADELAQMPDSLFFHADRTLCGISKDYASRRQKLWNIENDRTYAPVSFIYEKLGVSIEWNKTIHEPIRKNQNEQIIEMFITLKGQPKSAAFFLSVTDIIKTGNRFALQSFLKQSAVFFTSQNDVQSV